MKKDTGEIREYEKIPKKEIEFGKWSEPFHEGEIIELKGVRMKIKRIKKLRGELILTHHSK